MGVCWGGTLVLTWLPIFFCFLFLFILLSYDVGSAFFTSACILPFYPLTALGATWKHFIIIITILEFQDSFFFCVALAVLADPSASA